MTIHERIPTEIIQQLASSQAWEYRLVPYEKDNDALRCYGELGKEYGEITLEMEVLFGNILQIKPLEADELQKLLQQYYRNDGRSSTSGQAQTLSIAGGQGFLLDLIEEAFSTYASDIHFEPYEERCRVRFRIDGKLIERYVIERGNYAALVNQVKIMANLDISEKRLPQDGRIFYQRGEVKFDVRVSSLPGIYGEKIVLRLLTRHVELLELGNLGFSEKQLADYSEAIIKPHGLILISGPTGSGKSTTLYATLRRLNEEHNNILTVEDPVEYTLEGVNQVQLKEEIGLTFTSALRTFLRQDPDIIMLGEIRDGDTAQMAIRSSLTGHLIFSTIHTNSAWGSVARLVDMGVHAYLISNTLIMCIAQRLVRTLCPACKKKVRLSAADRAQAGVERATGFAPVGCKACYHTGYKGRKAIYEVIPIDNVLVEAIRTGRGDISAEMHERGIISLREAALELFRREQTSLDEVIPLLTH